MVKKFSQSNDIRVARTSDAILKKLRSQDFVDTTNKGCSYRRKRTKGEGERGGEKRWRDSNQVKRRVGENTST